MSSATTAAQLELINSLTQDDIPIKLRCAICSKLAVNAFRLPCCEQAICETCQSSLPSSCPVCEHTPVSAEDCKPNKSLRTTIKVFLRTEERKREALLSKEAKATPPETPVDATPTVNGTPIPSEPPAEDSTREDLTTSKVNTGGTLATEIPEGATSNPPSTESLTEAQKDIPQPSIEEIAPGQESTVEGEDNKAEGAIGEDDSNEATEKGDDQTAQSVSQASAFGFDPTMSGDYAGMGLGGDMNQMQQMMMMQNGMGPAAFGNFPMMGMPGMSMDPMTMQNMFVNGGFGAGMGMSSMNMGMGMGGFDGGMGAGFNNAWNGQQSWNVGPDNFNHPNAAGIGHGDYGANNSGYASQSAGYNQGNYGHANQYNDYENNFGYRGRGRGRGGYGRGGYGYGPNEAPPHQFPQQYGASQRSNGPFSETGSIPTGPKADIIPPADGTVDEFGREIRPKSAEKEDVSANTGDDAAVDAQNGEKIAENIASAEGVTQERPPETTANGNAILPIQTVDEIQVTGLPPAGPNGSGYNAVNSLNPARGGFGHGHFRGVRGGAFGTMQPVKPVDVPVNAPTGPKAMREGLPNTSVPNLRARGFPVSAPAGPRADSNSNSFANVAPESNDRDQKLRESRSPSRDRSRSHDRRRSRSRSRSRSKERRHRKHRHRSTSRSEDERETEKRRERRRERRRRRDEEEEDRGDDYAGDVLDKNKTDRIDEDRSRSASPSESRRSSRRSHRDRGKYRDRESDREYKPSSHKHRSSRRSHRDDRSRSRDRDREPRHRHSRYDSEDTTERRDRTEDYIETPVDMEDPSRRPSVISNGANGIEIKGTSSRTKPLLEDIKIPTGPRKDRVSSSHHESGKERPSSHRHHREEDTTHRSSRNHDSERSSARDRERDKEKEKTSSKVSLAPAAQDPHTLEREARNRERLLKEAQRIAGLTAGFGSKKRSHDEGDSGRNGRKRGRRGGTFTEDDDEARISRLEAEREGARWG